MTLLAMTSVSIEAVLVTLCIALVATIWGIIWTRVKDNEVKLLQHENRITVLENDIKFQVQMLNQKIDTLAKTMETLKNYVHDQMHKENNEKQMISNLLMRVDELIKHQQA